MAEDPSAKDHRSEKTGRLPFLYALLGDRERFFTEVVEEVELAKKLRHAIATVIVLSAFYGLVAGSYSSWMQAFSSALKLPALFLVTFVICVPVFFIVQILVGSRLRFLQVIILVMTALSLTAILLATFVPVVAFFVITGSNYYFLQLLHVVIVVIAGGLGMYVLHEALSLVCERRGVYPRKAMTIMRLWAVLFAFVGIQMAWNLRPFLGDRGQPFQVFRDYEGNYYAAIVYSVNKLLKGEDEAAPSSIDDGQTLTIEDLRQRSDSILTPRKRP